MVLFYVLDSKTNMRKSYKLMFKLNVIREVAEGKSIRSVAKRLKIQRSNIRRWIANKKSIEETHQRNIRNKIRGKNESMYPELDKRLFVFVKEQRESGHIVSGPVLKRKALDIAEEQGYENFVASGGFILRFLRRHNLRLRRITTSGRYLPTNTLEVVDQWLNDARQLEFEPRDMYNMDETSIYLDSPRHYTYDLEGVRRVRATTSGSERVRLSIALCSSATGSKLPLVIVVPRKTPLRDFQPPDNVLVVYKSIGTFDSESFCNDFIDRAFIPHVLRHRHNQTQSKPILVLDRAPCHRSAATISHIAHNGHSNIVLRYIPANMTNLLQPADVSW